MPRLLALSVVLLLVASAVVPAADYVVDNRNPAASDDNPGTWDKPWKTVAKAAATAEAGDTVSIMEGVYDEALQPRQSGTAEAPIVFRGLPRHAAQLKGADTGKLSHITLTGFRFAGEGVSVGGADIAIVDNLFEKVRRTTVGGSGSRITVRGNRSVNPSSGVFAMGEAWRVEANEVEAMIYQTGECDYGRFFGKGHVFRRNYFHGTAQADVAKSHVDGFQTYNLKAREDLQAHDMQFIDNVVFNFHQGIIARSADPGFLSNFTIRGNLFVHGLLPNTEGAAVGLIFESVPGVTVEHNLIADVRWFGFSPSRTTDGAIRNNIVYKVGSFDRGHRPEGLKVDHNIAFETKTEKLPEGAVIVADPMFIDPAADAWRLKEGSPAIGAASDGSAIGPFAWPNVYYVDSSHPGASDEAALGHPGRPFKTITHALKVARPGETVVVFGGIYRECPVAAADGVTLKAAEGQRVALSTADLVEGWARDGDRWGAPLARLPARLLRDGKPFTDFAYDDGTVRVRGFDPRLSLIETAARPKAFDAAGHKVTLERIELIEGR